MNTSAADDHDRRRPYVLTIECRPGQLVPRELFLDHDEPPWLVLSRRNRKATTVEDSLEQVRRNLSIGKSPDRLSVSRQAVDPGKVTHIHSRSRVIPSVLFLKVRSVDMCIDLGGADIGVTQHFLHGDEIRASLQEMGSEAVPQGHRDE